MRLALEEDRRLPARDVESHLGVSENSKQKFYNDSHLCDLPTKIAHD